MPKYIRVATEAGEFSAPESRKAALAKAGAKILDKPGADAGGNPLPYKPKTSVAAPAAKPSSPEVGSKDGQKATADTKEF